MSSERDKLLKMERVLASSVVGQVDAVKAVANAIRLSRSGLSNPNRPVASFLMAGPTGTGKTLLAKTVGSSPFSQNFMDANILFFSLRRCCLIRPTP